MYADINGDGKIPWFGGLNDTGTGPDIGNTTPRYQFGLDLNASWKALISVCSSKGLQVSRLLAGSTYLFGAKQRKMACYRN